jgi:hypothetical protein
MALIGKIYKHRARGTVYMVTALAKLQTKYDPPVGLHDDDVMVVYLDNEGNCHVREQREFDDGRFEQIY